MRLIKVLLQSLRLKCCLCGQGKMFRKWLIMNDDCPECGCHFEREKGFYLGSIYVNYGFTAISMTTLYMIAYFSKWADNQTLLKIALIYVVIVPAVIHPFARSIWTSFDHMWDPRDRHN